MNEDGPAFDIMLAALRRIARGEADPGIEARSALRQLGEEWKFDPRSAPPRFETFEDEIRADEEREIVAQIEAEEELGWEAEDDAEAELLGLDRESYDSLMHALMKND